MTNVFQLNTMRTFYRLSARRNKIIRAYRKWFLLPQREDKHRCPWKWVHVWCIFHFVLACWVSKVSLLFHCLQFSALLPTLSNLSFKGPWQYSNKKERNLKLKYCFNCLCNQFQSLLVFNSIWSFSIEQWQGSWNTHLRGRDCKRKNWRRGRTGSVGPSISWMPHSS